MKLSASAKIAFKQASEYLKACNNSTGIHSWYEQKYKSEYPSVINKRVKIGAEKWEGFLKLGFSANDVMILAREVLPDEQ